jgi:ubiquinone/menaquinone biosynthesis C-methylase UbiE
MVDTYGTHILDSGQHGAWERLFNRYMFESRFRDRNEIIDLGPGRCAFTKLAPERIIAVDNSPAVVDHYKSEGLHIRLGSADNLPFPDSSVDAVYSCWLLEHLSDPVMALRETRRVLRPNGYGLFIVPSVRSLARGFYNDYTHIRPYSPQSLAQVARAASLTNFSSKHLFWTKGLRRLIPLIGDQRMMGLLRLSDSMGRNVRCVNRDNLMFELWT